MFLNNHLFSHFVKFEQMSDEYPKSSHVLLPVDECTPTCMKSLHDNVLTNPFRTFTSDVLVVYCPPRIVYFVFCVRLAYVIW